MPETETKAPEQRTIDVDVEDIDSRGRTLVGYAAVYGAVADLGDFKETISRGAFATVLDADVRALLNHDPNQVLGRTKSGTLRLYDEPRGLRFEIDVPDSPLGENVRAAVRRGDIDGASFRFRVGEDRWSGDLRTIDSVAALHDVTLATYPAYPDSSVELRSRPNPATRSEDTDMSDSSTSPVPAEEARAEDTSEERSKSASNGNPEVKVTHEPAPALRVEDRASAPEAASLAEAYAERGFFENRTASLTWDEFRSFTWSAGTVLTDVSPMRRDGTPLGYDQRWLFPVLPTVAVDAATTAVQFLRQSSRSLAAGTAVVRPLDATTTKPETSSTAELVSQPLSQVATVSTGIPRIHAAQPMFQQIIEQDLRYALNDGLDQLVRTGVDTAGTAAAVTGDILEKVRKAKTVVQANGYNPTVLAIDPAGAQGLDLLRSSGSEAFYLWGPGQGAPGGPFGLQLRIWKSAGTAILDAAAFGELYVSPVELRSFEADAGVSNKQNVRIETNATFAVQRGSAALRIV